MGYINECKFRVLWIIVTMSRICCCDSSSIKNLRSNYDEKKCMSELLSNDILSDDQFTASSHLNNENIFQPKMARLLNPNSESSPSDGRAWCPKTAVHKELSEWIEVDFRRMAFVGAMYTMGRGDGNFKEFTPEIVIKYQRTDSGPWFTYVHSRNETIIAINTDSRSKLRTSLQTIVVKKIRIYPLDSANGPKHVCLKLGFLGCFFNDEVVSYTALQGDTGMIQNQLINLRDEKYDGTKSHILENGLGILMDNIYNEDSIAMNDRYYGSMDMNSLFTGWRCTMDRMNAPISITFYYNEERIFSRLSVYYVRNPDRKIRLSVPIIVSVGYNNDTHRYIHNNTVTDLHTVSESKSLLKIPLYQQRGNICTLTITCGTDNWIILDEVEITSDKSSDASIPNELVTTTRHPTEAVTFLNETKSLPVNNLDDNAEKKRDISLEWASGLAIMLLLILLSFVAFMFYKIRKLRKDKLNKKLELVAKCGDPTLCNPSGRTVFTIQSKHPSLSSIGRQNFYPDSKHTANNTYNGSQFSDGAYASWPNTDDDVEVPNVDKEEEKCLLGTEPTDNHSMNKDYAIYQPGVNFSDRDYFHGGGRPSSTLVYVSNPSSLSDKVPLSVAHLKIVSSYDIPKSTPIVTYRTGNNVVSYQHFINYRGICGDVDLRYQSLPARSDQYGLDSNIQALSTTSIIFVQPWVRGQFGCIDLVTVALNHNDTGRYFMKKLNHDSPNNIKTKFILDLKVLSSLNVSSIARLAAIVVESDRLPEDIAEMVRCARFCLLIEHNGGYNLKDFLRNIYYPTQNQNYKTTTLTSQSQISLSSMLLIITQISNALRHLEELNLTHRDVGCRNCIIDARRQVKLYPGGYVTTQPLEDYCSIELHNHLVNFPLRWLAPESIAKGVFTTKSDVWSFGVTMWEVFTLCSLMPYPSLANEALLELIIDRDNCPRLPCPQNCPREMYDLMTQCWSWDECLRPTFLDINLFLQIKTAGPSNQAQLILPAPPPQ